MNNPFVKTVTTKKIVDAINVDGPGGCYMSFEEHNGGIYNLVIGAKYEDRCAALFNRRSIKELIDILQEIHDTL
jgi:hypothetical protein